MVRIGIVASLVVLVSGSALCEPLRAISGRPLLLPFGIEGGAVSPDGRWFAAQGGHADMVVVHIATNALVRRNSHARQPDPAVRPGVPVQCRRPDLRRPIEVRVGGGYRYDAQRLPDGTVAAGESGRRRAHIAVAADPLAPAR